MSCLLRGFVLLLSSSPFPRGHPLSACLEATPSPSASCPPTDAHAARMVKFEREQLIVDCLDCGVSACWSLLREAPRRVALQPEGGEVRPAASAGEARAEIPRSPPSARTPSTMLRMVPLPRADARGRKVPPTPRAPRGWRNSRGSGDRRLSDCGGSACRDPASEAPRRVALQPEGGEVRPAASTGDTRPEIPPQAS